MIAAERPVQRRPGAKILAVDRLGEIRHLSRARLADLFRPGDLVIANDAATLPASLTGWHLPSDQAIEIRLAGRRSLSGDDIHRFTAILFGAGDFRVRTEDRSPPPKLLVGDTLLLGPLRATVTRTLSHPRFIEITFTGSPDEIWKGLARHGRPVQYSHVPTPLALWDVWTAFAAVPAAFEAPSAGFALDWRLLAWIRKNGVQFLAITHAAGLSSTGDPVLDAQLPLDEPYDVPQKTAAGIRNAKSEGRRIIAVGTTVVRALEDAANPDGTVRAGPGLATRRIDRFTQLRVINAILSGTHEPDSSHHDLLRAFVDDATLRRMDHALADQRYLTHEFGDSVFVERQGINT